MEFLRKKTKKLIILLTKKTIVKASDFSNYISSFIHRFFKSTCYTTCYIILFWNLIDTIKRFKRD